MEVVRFYSVESRFGGPELLAKYIYNKDGGGDVIRGFCKDMIFGIHDAKDVVDFLNEKILEINGKMVAAGFERVPSASSEDYDNKSSASYDICIYRDDRYVRVLSWSITKDEDDIKKSLSSDNSYGRLVIR